MVCFVWSISFLRKNIPRMFATPQTGGVLRLATFLFCCLFLDSFVGHSQSQTSQQQKIIGLDLLKWSGRVGLREVDIGVGVIRYIGGHRGT